MQKYGFTDILKYEWTQFCLNTTLHGWKFTILPKRTRVERCLWCITCLASMATSLTLLLIAWFDFQKNPTIVVTDSTQYPIMHYSFPAVTICNFNTISKENAYELAKKLKKPDNFTTKMMAEELRLLFYLMKAEPQNIARKRFEILQQTLIYNHRSVEKVFEELTPACHNTKIDLSVEHSKGERNRKGGTSCTLLVSKSLGRPIEQKASKFPRRISACGYQTGLEVLLQNRAEDYFAATVASVGFKVFIHHPYEYPDLAVQVILADRDTNMLIGVSPEKTVVSESIKKTPISRRNCLFSQEGQLMNFASYNFHNCMVECKINLTLKFCNCVPFYLYNNEGTMRSRKICNLEDIPCLTVHEELIMSSITSNNSNDSDNEMLPLEEQCQCVPDCESSTYISEYSMGILDGTSTVDRLSIYENTTLVNKTLLRIFFNDLVGIRHRSGLRFTWHTALAYYGGILGLFIGFSFLSLVEIVYYFTIKLIFDLKNNRLTQRNQQQGFTFEHVQVNRTSRQQTLHKVYPSIREVAKLDPGKLSISTENIEVRRRSNGGDKTRQS